MFAKWLKPIQVFLVVWLAACTSVTAQPTDTRTATEHATTTQIPATATRILNPTISSSPLPSPTATPTPSPLSLGPAVWAGRGKMIDAAFLPDGSALLVGWVSGMSLTLLDSGEEAWYMPGPASLLKVDVDPQGQSAAAVFTDGSVMVVTLASGLVKTFHPNVKESGIWGSLAWSPDGKTIAFQLRGSHRNDPVFLLDVSTGQISQVPGTENIWPNMPDLIWSPDGKTIALASVGSSCSRLLDVASGAERMRLGKPNNCLAGEEVAGWSPDGSAIAALDPDGSLELLSFPDGAILCKFSGPGLLNVPGSNGRIVSFSPDGKWIVGYFNVTYFGSQAFQAIAVWSTTSGNLIAQYNHSLGGDGLARRLTATFAGDSLLMAYSDGAVTRWNFLQGSAESQIFQASGFPSTLPAILYTLGWAKNSNLIAFTVSDPDDAVIPGGVVVRDNAGNLVTQMQGAYDSPALSANGRLLAAVDRQKDRQEVIELATGKTLFSLPGKSLPGGAAFSPDGKYLAYSQGQNAAILDLATGEIHVLEPSADFTSNPAYQVTYLIWSPDSQSLVVADGDPAGAFLGKVTLWQKDASGHFKVLLQVEDGFASYANAMVVAVFNPSGTRVALQKQPSTENARQEVVVYDLKRHAVVQDLTDFYFEQWVDDQILVVREAEYDMRMMRLNVVSGKQTAATGRVSNGEYYAPNGLYFAQFDGDGTGFTIRDWYSGAELAKGFQGSSISDYSWSPDGRFLATTAVDGSIRLWPLVNSQGLPSSLQGTPTIAVTQVYIRTPYVTPTFEYAAQKQAAVQSLQPYLVDLPFWDPSQPGPAYQEYRGCVGSMDASGILDYTVEQPWENVKDAFVQYFQSKEMLTSSWLGESKMIARSSSDMTKSPLILYRVDVEPLAQTGIALGVYIIENPSAFQETDNLDEAFTNYCPQGVWLWLGP